MIARRSLLCGVGFSALHAGWVGTAAGTSLGFLLSGSAGNAAPAVPRPDQRDPTANDDSTQGNIIGRRWLNSTTGQLWQATDVTPGNAVWSDQGVPSAYPGDTGTWFALLGTKPLTSAYAIDKKPFVDVYTVDKDVGITGPHTIYFINGVIDTRHIRSLQGTNADTAGMPENTMCSVRMLLVTKWYDQSGNNRHYVQPWPGFMPTLWLIDGAADGTGESSVRIAFSRNKPLTDYRACDRHLVLQTGTLNTRSTTVYIVCQPHEASNDNSDPSVFGTSASTVYGVNIATSVINWVAFADPNLQSGIAKWRVANLDAQLSTAATPFSTSPTVMSVALRAAGIEFATNDDIATLPALPDVYGTGSIIGAGYKSWNSGDPFQGSSGHGFYGTIDAVLVRETADDANTTKGVRSSLHHAFSVVPQAANDTVVIEGDSGTVSWGGVFPLIPYIAGGNYHLADIGVDGYGLNWMIQRKTSRLVRFVQLGRVGTGWIDPTTDTNLTSLYNRIPAIRAQYNPSAKRNICIVYSHGIGITDADPGTAITTYNFMVTWLNALRDGGQNWTVVLGFIPIGNPGGAWEQFRNLVISNASTLNVSYFTELTPAQISAILTAPNKLINLYLWNETNWNETNDEISGRYNGHGTPLLYVLESTAWAAAIDAVL
jgi:hypothetical protein